MENNPQCKNNLSKVLKLFKVGSIVIGHTPQSFICNDFINSTCDNKVWRVDNGSSSAFDVFDNKYMNSGVKSKGRNVQYLMIIDDDKYFVCNKNKCMLNK